MGKIEYRQRVVEEKVDLDEKKAKLNDFFETDLFKGLDKSERDLLVRQHNVMSEYSNILYLRVEHFK